MGRGRGDEGGRGDERMEEQREVERGSHDEEKTTNTTEEIR